MQGADNFKNQKHMITQHILATNTDQIKIQFDQKGIELRDRIILQSSDIKTIDDRPALELAIKCSGLLQGYLKEVENARKAVKQPFDAIATTIQTIAKEASAPAESERLRLNKLAADYQSREQERVRKEEQARLEEQRKAQEEIARKQREEQGRLDKIKREQQAEALRLENLANAATNAKAKKAAEEQARVFAEEKARQEAEALKRQKELALEASEASESTPVETVEKVSGAKESFAWVFEVTDIKALYKAHPECVKLTELKTEIKDLLDMTGGKEQIAGLKFHKELKISTTARVDVAALN